MISLGSRDGREGLGIGFGDMEEAELEEGEAYQNDGDSTMDPDVALSYIDEKLQHVLGHFQKDFEGGVSAENLGAKFGGYGSFLPTYQRSPAWSHPRTPTKGHNDNTPSSPKNLHTEGAGRDNFIVSSSASRLTRPGLASLSAASVPAVRAPSLNGSVKRDVSMSSTRAEEFTSKCEPLNKFTNPSDQKSLKVRIKVGSDNLSTRKNAEIYSGLGLDVSPSSSLDGSPTDSEGLSREPRGAPDESPTSILQLMTSFPVCGSLLLSPLSNDLIRFSEKEKHWERKSVPVHKGNQETPAITMNGYDSARSDRKVKGEKKPRPSERNVFPVESKNGNDYAAQNGIGTTTKEKEIDASACDEIVSNALRLPLLSNASCHVVDSAKDISTVASTGGVKEEYFSDLPQEELLEPVSVHENGWVDKFNGRAGSDGNLVENKIAIPSIEDSFNPRKGENLRGEKSDVPAKADSNASKGSRCPSAELIDPPKQNAGQKATSNEEDATKLAPEKELSSSSGRRKSKGSQSFGGQVVELPKDGSSIDTSSVPKSRTSTQPNNSASKNKVEDFRRDYGKDRERYKDFFGDLEPEDIDNEIASEELPSTDGPKDYLVGEKSTFKHESPSKGRLSVKNVDVPSTSKAYPRATSIVAPLTGNGPTSDAAATGAPVVKEDWVCCDKCQKWRLLPNGKNPESLPEKWLCSMLDWLPGMNRCSISEEETTKALIAPFQIPAPAHESQGSQHGHPGGTLLGASSTDAPHFDQNHQDLGPTGGRKRHGSKDSSNAANQDGSIQFPSTIKKNLQASVKGKSLSGVKKSPTLDFQHSGHSSSLVAEKHRHKQKDKNRLHDNYSSGGDTRNSKNRKKKRETDQDCLRASKKIKTEGMQYADEDGTSDQGGAVGKVGRSSSSGRPKVSNSDSKVSGRKSRHQIQPASDDGSLHIGKSDDRDTVKKRKVNECQDTKISTLSHPSAGHILQDSRDFLERTSENDHRKEKKARASRSGGNGSGRSQENGGTEKKYKSLKDQQVGPDVGSTLSHRSLDAVDLKRDLGAVQPSVAATSSSSKVSGSRKSKANPQEVKGSPVESVSSSPMRILNPDKLMTTRQRKDDCQDAGYFATTSPRKFSDGEDEGGSHRSGTDKKDGIFTVAHRGSLESEVLDFQDGEIGQISGGKAKGEIVPSPEFATHHVIGDVDGLGQGAQHPLKPQTSEQSRNEERGNGNQYPSSGSRPRKSGKGSSSRSKDKSRSFKSDSDKGNLKISDSYQAEDHTPHAEKMKAGREKFPEKVASNSDKVEKKLVSKKDSTGNVFNEGGKSESQSKFGRHVGSDVKVDTIFSQEPKLLVDRDGERSSSRVFSDKSDRVEVSGRGKSLPLPPSGRDPKETPRWPQPLLGSHKHNGANIASGDAPDAEDALKAPKQIKKAENQNGIQPKDKDLDTSSPVRKDSSNQAATNAVKEAKDLKHLADRLKNSGSSHESTGLYFQAALKFLHGASLLESGSSESTKHGEQSMQMYSSTAKLCEFCAHEYEKSKDMAAAALAYKCTEVAHLRVIYSSHTNASRDRHELQTTLQMVPPGESPSSSASDIDNLNNPATVDKPALAKGISSPQVPGNHVIAARYRSNFVRLLNFAQDVNYAMEASRKSRIAFAAANPRLDDAKFKEGISSVKRALDFNFQDVEGLLRLVRLAMEAISR